MTAGTMRIRFDRRTGKEISRTFFDPFEITEEEYLDRLIVAMTGKGPESVARDLLREYYQEQEKEDKQLESNRNCTADRRPGTGGDSQNI